MSAETKYHAYCMKLRAVGISEEEIDDIVFALSGIEKEETIESLMKSTSEMGSFAEIMKAINNA